MADVTWEQVLAKLDGWFTETWVLDPQQRALWLGIIAMALRLEFLAYFLLWLHEHPTEDPNEEFDFGTPRLTLGQAAQRIEDAGLLDARTVDILRAVWELRNSVAHKSAMFAVALPREDSTGVYRRSGHVFSDPRHYARFLGDGFEAYEAIYAAVPARRTPASAGRDRPKDGPKSAEARPGDAKIDPEQPQPGPS
jgi:hypothetical protein